MALTAGEQPIIDVATSIPAMVFGQVELRRAETVLRQKSRGIWKATTWAEFGTRIRHFAMGLRAIGFGKGEVACVLADTSPAWVTADLGIISAGGISAGLYTTTRLDDLRDQLRACRCAIVFVGNEEQLDKVLEVRGDCPDLKHIVIFSMKGLRDFSDPMCESLASFLTRGQSHDAAHVGEWQAQLATIAPDDPAVLSYTAGSTGKPKAVLLTHRNILHQIAGASALLGQRAGDERLAFLPMAHFIERIVGLYPALYTATVSNYVESAETVSENLREIRPTVLIAPPRFWEQIYKRVTLTVASATWLQRKLYGWAMRAGERAAEAGERGSIVQRAFAAAGSLLVLRHARQATGLNNVRIGCVGGAPVSPGMVRWYRALGIDLVEFYGLSEAAGLALRLPRRGGATDLAMCGDVKLSDTGEILIQGHHVAAGYWPAAQMRARTTEWFATGDIARQDDQGFRVIGRAEDLITVQSGRSVIPAEIEAALKFSPYIADAIVVGDGRAHLGCLVMIDHENVEKWAQDHRVAFTSVGQLARSEAVRALIEGEIARTSAALPVEIRTFGVIERKFEPEDPELTPMLQLRRGYVQDAYKNLIDPMYCET